MSTFPLLESLIAVFDQHQTNDMVQLSGSVGGKECEIAYSARLMALYRSQENEVSNPLIKDPFAD